VVAVGNRIVGAVLRSPAHRLLSGTTDLVRYTGRRSGRTIETPTQYVAVGDGLVIVVAHPATKTWWRNFVVDGPIEVLVAGTWRPMTARVVRGADDPASAGRLLDAYLARFPRAGRALAGATREEQVEAAVLVWCTPR
jgi:deazaflavin-dependent oxidoreductase (nitroreductase family)